LSALSEYISIKWQLSSQDFFIVYCANIQNKLSEDGAMVYIAVVHCAFSAYRYAVGSRKTLSYIG